MSLNKVYKIYNTDANTIIELRKEFDVLVYELECGRQINDAHRFYALYNTILDKTKEFAGTCSSCLKRMLGEYKEWCNSNPINPPVPVEEVKPKAKKKNGGE